MTNARLEISTVAFDNLALQFLLSARRRAMPLASATSSPTDLWYLAMAGAEAVGCVSLSPLTDGFEVRRLFVLPEVRGCGVARALMAHVETVARVRAAPVLRLESGRSLDAAHRLYLAMGFLPGEVFGAHVRSDDSCFFVKALS